ncbi:LysR substrate-binding domain-containing protein [Streptomyces sp. NRRL S-455]|uniref:LysR substrate-binding domain-containing protein n=1 Tax=Streptomyces sp. NRRL S-455 TaxID=1463908 RepID=UPI001F42A257|nr:LysR substrate-binding domain-containing protein [Streptomyces sp. NRRL S-455]
MLAAEGLTARLSCEGDEPAASQDMISAGLGIGLIPAMSRQVGTEAHAPVAWVRVDAPHCRRILTLVWNRDAHLSEAASKFREFTTGRPFMAHRLPDARYGPAVTPRGRNPR